MKLTYALPMLARNPLVTSRLPSAVARAVRWSLLSGIGSDRESIPFVNGTRLGVHPYSMEFRWAAITGLHEFEEMCLVAHFLDESDLFVDVGTNIGVFSILASGVARSRTIAIEPAPETHRKLVENIRFNSIENLVTPLNIAVGHAAGSVRMTSARDTENHILSSSENALRSTDVSVSKLDDVLASVCPSVLKIDVEGYEGHVVRGGSETLSRESLSALIVELNGNCQRYGTSPDEIHAEICAYGFMPVTYNPKARRLATLENRNPRSVNTMYVRNVKHAAEKLAAARPFTIFGKSI